MVFNPRHTGYRVHKLASSIPSFLVFKPFPTGYEAPMLVFNIGSFSRSERIRHYLVQSLFWKTDLSHMNLWINSLPCQFFIVHIWKRAFIKGFKGEQGGACTSDIRPFDV